MNRDLKETAQGLFVAIILIFGLAIIIAFCAYGEKNILCPKIGEELNMNTKYNFWAEGCYVEVSEGKWISNKNYRITN